MIVLVRRYRSVDCGTGKAKAGVRGLIFLIKLYQHTISPLRPASCRFVPTCSQYAVEALTEHGVIRGSWLVVARLAKCGPWHRGGWDPIPDRLSASSSCRTGFDDMTNIKGESLV